MASMASKESKSIYGNSSSRHNWMFETKEALNNVRENKIKKYYMILKIIITKMV